MKLRWVHVVFGLLLAVSVTASAQAPASDAAKAPSGVTWQQLTPEQRKALERFESRWWQLPPDRQAALLSPAVLGGFLAGTAFMYATAAVIKI